MASLAIPSSSPGLESDVQRVRVVFAGSRKVTDANTVLAIADRLDALGDGDVVITGGAQGVDEWVHRLASTPFSTGPHLRTEVYRAEWDRLGKRAGPERNARMLDSGCDLLVAFPGGVGTRNCIRQAHKRGIPVELIQP